MRVYPKRSEESAFSVNEHPGGKKNNERCVCVCLRKCIRVYVFKASVYLMNVLQG